ncbi:aminopeptidase N [Atopomonas sediminilitoris]|uniref:aminopeptidase N n=1 Tax=Atopomonas sediminilitoris TaxID=2919919 RepID=UPI001F4E8EC4|nr:aminopeptidase N [Atopomonas sediminilitoris]MCJ8168939.1 aminopeptidase N [Atopomonas sediminilitoris]
MRTETPVAVQLKDYQAPDYFIERTLLDFDLYDDHSTVRAELTIARNTDKGSDLPPLRLDGQQLELVSITLDGQALAADAYQLTDSHLILQPLSANFVVHTEVRIHPENNTALEGLYRSGKMFCTQCEAEGFRKITYYLDRPDVMSAFTTTVRADKQRFPVLLSNGNPLAQGEEGTRHWATWEDPFKKPAYLFALVAGDLWCVEDSFTTMSGRDVALRIYVEPENLGKVQHAMDSLKKSMRWDEEVYGREYDLDIFMIVAVSDFNMGAMENKGLNIFNSSCVLASPDTATDAAHQRVEAVVAHEYFHNWSGNRVTCRDWFQLSLKEGFTVFRDAEFSADMNSRTVKRIEDVAFLRTNQFAEDAGPMAHPIRPDAYIEISNFYTLTVYEKGAEVVRMLRTLLGEANFRKGSDLYFARHDGQAVTCDDFVQAMQDASGTDLGQFKRWYSQAGTPRLTVSSYFDKAAGEYTLTFQQSCPATPGQSDKLPFVIPVELALLAADGSHLPLQLKEEDNAQGCERVLAVTEAEQQFTFVGIANEPLPSLLRSFSAPVKLRYDYSREQLLALMRYDSDGFNRWEAGQQLQLEILNQLIADVQAGRELRGDVQLAEVFAGLLADTSLDAAMLAEMLTLPSEALLAELADVADVHAIHQAREFLRQSLAQALHQPMWQRYQALRAVHSEQAYAASAEQIAGRSLQGKLLAYLMLSEHGDVRSACVAQFEQANNMTERLQALACLVNSPFVAEKQQALASFAAAYADDALVMDQWFSVQAGSSCPGTLAQVQALMQHPAFSLKNPNKVRALVGVFCAQNAVQFHAEDGAGYRFLADQVITLNALNPQIASRLLTPLTRWRKYAPDRQAQMRNELERIVASGELSADVYEVVSKSLAS